MKHEQPHDDITMFAMTGGGITRFIADYGSPAATTKTIIMFLLCLFNSGVPGTLFPFATLIRKGIFNSYEGFTLDVSSILDFLGV